MFKTKGTKSQGCSYCDKYKLVNLGFYWAGYTNIIIIEDFIKKCGIRNVKDKIKNYQISLDNINKRASYPISSWF